MPGRKKKFIDKKSAVTFSVVSRSQRDPQLLAGNSENVLQQQKTKKADQKIEQHKYGIYYDDDYDYLQHLKDVDELHDVEILDRCRVAADIVKPDINPARLTLPSSVFGSAVETKVGLLNRAAPLKGPRLDWDPDIVAGLDVDFNFEDPANVLEDDFISMAEGPVAVDETELSEELEDLFEDEDKAIVIRCQPSKVLQSKKGKEDEACTNIIEDDEDTEDDDDDSNDDDSDDDFSIEDSESDDGKAKTALTSYSMSSSVMPRNAGLSLLDDRFEKFAESYCEEDIGDLAHEEIEGFIRPDNERVNMLISHHERRHKKTTLKEFTISAADRYALLDKKEDMVDMVIEAPTDKWDCESILSTRSTLFNHPKVIKEPSTKVLPIKLTKHTEIPSDVLIQRGPTRRQLEKESNTENLTEVLSQRLKGESLEEKKARKQAIRDIRRFRREQKSATKKVFREEKLKQDKEMVYVQQTIQTVRIT